MNFIMLYCIINGFLPEWKFENPKNIEYNYNNQSRCLYTCFSSFDNNIDGGRIELYKKNAEKYYIFKIPLIVNYCY